MRGGTVCLPTPPSWPEVPCFLMVGWRADINSAGGQTRVQRAHKESVRNWDHRAKRATSERGKFREVALKLS